MKNEEHGKGGRNQKEHGNRIKEEGEGHDCQCCFMDGMRGKLGVRIRYARKRMEMVMYKDCAVQIPFASLVQDAIRETPPAAEMLHLPQCWS